MFCPAISAIEIQEIKFKAAQSELNTAMYNFLLKQFS